MTDNNDLLKQIGNLIDQKLEPLKKQLDTVELKVEAVNSNIGKVKEEIIEHIDHSVEGIFEVVGEQHRKLEKRVENLEEVLHSPHKN